MRLRAVVEYDGADFRGWQRQAEGRTVQGALEEALARVTGEPIQVVGSGRTDAGVHATGQVAHFDTDWHIDRGIETLLRAVNAELGWDVALRGLYVTAAGFHARHSATARTYRYRIWTDPVRSPTRRRRMWHVWYPLDLDAMQRAGSELVGVHDFAAFGQPMTPDGPTVRRLDQLELQALGREIHVTVTANAFLRHQVRRTVGFLVDVGRDALSDDATALALAGKLDVSPRRAPPQGLCLEAVSYPPDERGAPGDKRVETQIAHRDVEYDGEDNGVRSGTHTDRTGCDKRDIESEEP